MTILADIGAASLWLLYGWLLCSYAASYLSERKGYGIKLGLGLGMLTAGHRRRDHAVPAGPRGLGLARAGARRAGQAGRLATLLLLTLAATAQASAGGGSSGFGGGGGGGFSGGGGGGGFSGGGGGGGFSGGTGGGGGAWLLIIIAIIVFFVILPALRKAHRRDAAYAKASRERLRAVQAAAAEAAEDDPAFDPAEVAARARELYLAVQDAWSRNDRARLRELVFPDLMAEWDRRLDDFASRGQRNVVDVQVLEVHQVGLVNRTDDEDDRVVVLMQATLLDYVSPTAGGSCAPTTPRATRRRSCTSTGRSASATAHGACSPSRGPRRASTT